MPLLYILLLLVWFAVVLKSITFWIYLWQLKEYRFDRFWAEYGEPGKLLRFWIFSGGRKFWQPKWTAKAILISLFSLVITLVIAFILLLGLINETKQDLIFSAANVVLILALIYLFVPIVVSLAVFIFKIPTYLIKRNIYRRAALKIAGMKNLIVIGITGSFGKSSTKEFLAQILARKFRVAKTPENVNSEIGAAKFVLEKLPADAEIFIVEMGAYKIGEIKRICDIVKPKIGILTGLNEQHLALFGSMENIKKAKFELIEALSKDGLAVFNGENKHCLEMAEKWQGKKNIYHNANLQMYPNIANAPKHYLLNLAGAIEVARYLWMDDGEIEQAIGGLKFSDRMMKSFIGKNNTLIIDDTYSANPDGVLAALNYLASQPQKNKIIVMPCLIELGGVASKIHRQIGKKINEICDLAIITTPDYFEDIKKEAGEKAILETNPEKIIEILENKLNPGAALLLEGRLPDEVNQSLK